MTKCTPIPPEGTRVRVKHQGPLKDQTCMPGVKAGTEGIVRHESPAGVSNLPSFWLELEDPIVWSHRVQEPPYGFWCSTSNVEMTA